MIIILLNYRESKKKLEELLSEWSKWHAAHCVSSKVRFFFLSNLHIRSPLCKTRGIILHICIYG